MKKLLVLIIFISSLKIFAQREIQYIETMPESFKKIYFEKRHEYNPLHIGDLWQYSTSAGYDNWLILGDTLVGNMLYFRKKTNFTTTWERNDSIKQSSYLLDLDDLDEDGNTKEELLLDSLEVPNFTKYVSYRLITKDNPPDVPFEAFVEDSSWSIIFGDTVMTRRIQYLSSFTTQIVADKFGVIWSMTEGPPRILNGANINGITYGLIVSVNDEQFPIIPDKLILSQNYPNPFSKDEMSYEKYYLGIHYACFAPNYNKNSAWGDDEDAFDMNFNNVFFPVSNPRSTNSGNVDFAMEVIQKSGSQYKIQLYFTNPYAGKPSKSQNLKVVPNGTHPVISWDANTEPDLNGYSLYRSSDGGGFYYIANLDKYTTSYIDNEIIFYKPIWQVKVVYKVKARDTQNQYSLLSNPVSINGQFSGIPKISKNEEQTKITNYSIAQNYPNPFNPSTKIEFQIPQDAFVNMRVYNSVGQQVATIVKSKLDVGNYTVDFNAVNLPSGIYFYKIQANEYMKIKKMILLK